MNDDRPLYKKGDIIDGGYGYYRPEDPRDFTPDQECCTPQEIATHKAAREAWDKASGKPADWEAPQGSAWLRYGDSVIHVLRAPWGIGSYVIRAEEDEPPHAR